MKSTGAAASNSAILVIVVCTILQLLLWIPCYIYQSIVLAYVRHFRKDLRKKLIPISHLCCDNFYKDPLNWSLTVVLELKNRISLHTLTEIFHCNVIHAKVSSRVRYPELTQYPVSFMGYKFWKSDSNFKIENHIWENPISSRQIPVDSAVSLASIHESMCNQVYPECRSPWELVLFRDRSECGTSEKTFLAMRIHHSMADAKSIVKLLVEALGKKRLTSAVPQQERERSILEKVLFVLLLPYKLIKLNILAYRYHLNSKNHPMWNADHLTDNSKSLIGFTSKISLFGIKQKAKKNGLRPSAVILSGITFALQKFGSGMSGWNRDVAVQYPLPKANHPPTLTNHVYISFPILPFHATNPDCGLQCCHEEFQSWRTDDRTKCIDIMFSIISTCSSLTFRILLATFGAAPWYITNIAGEEEGFSVGGVPCEDFTFGGMIPRSLPTGIGFYVFSYKGSFRVCASTRGSVFKREELAQLTDYIDKEFAALGHD